ncbi:MAG: 2-oxoacid:acceptor oxidoreductase family protein [Clostridia bacterium]|nr:2-oxoacid:acceptor oxidoreductase family protein [Clostridia bacterium]
MIEIRWHGRGGQGAFTAAKVLGAAVTLHEGKHALAFPSFGPELRGAPVLAFTKIDSDKIRDRSEIKACDFIVFLDETLVRGDLIKAIKPGGTVLINSKHPEKYQSLGTSRVITLPATDIALEILKRPVTNTAMLGALLGASDIVTLESGLKALADVLPAAIAAKNGEVLKTAYERVKEAFR